MSQNVAFETLVHEWYDRLYRFALSLTHNRDDALDLTQQTFAKWAEKGHQLRDQKRVKTWLFTVLYHEFIAKVRHGRRWNTESGDEPLKQIPAEGGTAQDATDGGFVLDALWSLDEAFRAPLALFYLQDHSYREIAEILDVPIGTVMSRLARGREHLRARLELSTRDASDNVIQMPGSRARTHG